MRTLAVVSILFAAACGASSTSSAPAAPAAGASAATPAAPARPAFEPTSFGVEVGGTGRPVILIPGLGCPASIWKETIAHLAPTAQTHVLTLSGFAGRPPIASPGSAGARSTPGGSAESIASPGSAGARSTLGGSAESIASPGSAGARSAPGGSAESIDTPLIATARAELAAYIRDRHLDHPVVIGHSLGGFLAYWIAATEPDLVGPVVAVDAIPTIGAFPGAIDQGAKMRDTWKKQSADEFAKAIREFFGTMANDPKKLEPLLTEILRSDQRTMADAFYELFSTDIRSDLPKIQAPVLAILADSPYQKLIGEQLAPVPHHEVVTLPHTKHIVMYDDPVGFFRALDTFLARR